MPITPSLPLSNILPVSVIITQTAPAGPSFNQALIVGPSAVIPSVGGNSRCQLFLNTAAILTAGFSTTSPEYLAAQEYFSQIPQPTYLWLGRQDLTAIGAANIGSTPGTGYLVGDIVTVVQSGGSAGQIKITSVGVAGAVNGIALIQGSQGTGYAVATNLATTGGSGTSLTISITQIGETPLQAVAACRLNQPAWYACAFVGSTSSPVLTAAIGAAGTQYVVGDLATVIQAGAGGAQVKVTAVTTGGVVSGISLVNGGANYTAASGLATLENGNGIYSVAIGSGTGTGYAVNDVVTVTQAGGVGGKATVTSVSGGGVVTGLSLLASGSGYASASNLATTTTGAGTGLTVTIVAAAGAGLTLTITVGNIDQDILSIAQFIEGASPNSVYFVTSSEAAILNNTTPNIAATLQAAALRRTEICYATTQGGLYPNNIYACAGVMGYAMGANTGAPGSYFILNNKTIQGVAYEPLTQSQAIAISGTPSRASIGLNCNLFLNYNNGSYILYQPGVQSGGTFFDIVLQLDMLASDMQFSGVNLLTALPALQITDAGVVLMKNVLAGACLRSQQRGFIAPSGTWQGQSVGTGNAGIVAGNSLPQGFYLYAAPVSTLSAGQKASRQLPPITCLIILAGGAQSISVTIQVQQ